MELTWSANTEGSPALSRTVRPYGEDSFHLSWSGILPKGTPWQSKNELLKPAVVDWLEISGNTSTSPQIEFRRRRPDGSFESLTFLKADGSSTVALNPSEAVAEGVSIFDIKVWDHDSGRYKIALNRQLYFPHGFIFSVRNAWGSSEPQCAVSMYGRTF